MKQWPQDEASVKANTCTFEVKYLGNIEVGGASGSGTSAQVFESRGMQVCEEAVKLLKNSKRRPIKVRSVTCLAWSTDSSPRAVCTYLGTA